MCESRLRHDVAAAATDEVNLESFYAIHDMLSALFARIAFPEKASESMEFKAPGPVSYAFGKVDLFEFQRNLESCYTPLADMDPLQDTRKRAVRAISRMTMLKYGREFLQHLPLAIAMPLREAARTCQINPPQDWNRDALRFVGRNDLAGFADGDGEPFFKDGYRTVKDHLVCIGHQ
jgi:anaphase-promoting complex subunit 1